MKMLGVRGLSFVVLAAAMAVAPVARAQPSPEAERAFREGEVSYRLGRYAEAIAAFENAYRLTSAPKLLFNIAQAYRKRFEVVGDPTDLRRARELYQTYLRVDPRTTQRREVQGILVEIEARLADPAVAAGLPLLELRPPGPVLAGTGVELPVTVSRDPLHRVAQVVLRYRRGSEGELRESSATTGQPVRISAASLPAAGAPYQVHYFLEGRAADGRAIAELGSAAEPLVLDVQAPPPATSPARRRAAPAEASGSIFGTWWFWTLTGVVVVGAAATTAVVLTGDGGTPDSDLGAVDLR